MRLKKEKRAARTLAKRSGRKRPSKNALGYALAGYTNSFGAGSYDFWLVKTDSSGSMMWNQTYGGSGDDEAYSLVQTSDGGYALAGFTASYGAGSYDAFLVSARERTRTSSHLYRSACIKEILLDLFELGIINMWLSIPSSPLTLALDQIRNRIWCNSEKQFNNALSFKLNCQ